MFEILNVLITPMSWYNGTYTIGNRIVENGTVKLNTTLKKMKKKALPVNNIGYFGTQWRRGI